MRQRFLPKTAGDLHGQPDRVFAPHRRLEHIGLVFPRMITHHCRFFPAKLHYAVSCRFAAPFTKVFPFVVPRFGRFAVFTDWWVTAICLTVSFRSPPL